MNTTDDGFFREVQLITAAYCAVKNLPMPERFKDITPEELAPYKERVKAELEAV